MPCSCIDFGFGIVCSIAANGAGSEGFENTLLCIVGAEPAELPASTPGGSTFRWTIGRASLWCPARYLAFNGTVTPVERLTPYA
jgi:hypothetical protein